MRLILVIAVFAAIGATMPGGVARAQSGGNPLLNPYGAGAAVPSWERSLQQYYDRERMARQRATDPLAGLRTSALDRRQAMLRRFYGDPSRALGLPANPQLPGSETDDPAVAPPAFAPTVSLLDIDGDGAVSRQEYFNARARFIPLGPQSFARSRRASQRLASQFRALDVNKDGRVTPDETAPYPDARF